MYNVQILITDNFLTDGVYKKHYLEPNSNQSMALNFSINDIKNISTRSGSYSKTISIPGTKTNNIILKNIFEVNIDSPFSGSNLGTDTIFNPAKKAYCTLLVDTIPVLQGYMQVVSVDVNNPSEIVYEVNLYGQVLDLVTSLGDKLLIGNDGGLGDLSFPELAHSVDASAITFSWAGTSDLGYIWPLIDYGYSFSADGLSGTPPNYGYEPLTPYTNIFPCIYVKRIFDKILRNAGYTYTSTFLNSDLFKRLFIPSKTADAQNALCKAQMSNGILLASGGPRGSYAFPAFDNIIYDNASYLNSVTIGTTHTYNFKPTVSAFYNFKFTLDGTMAAGDSFTVDIRDHSDGSAMTIGAHVIALPSVVTLSANLTAGTYPAGHALAGQPMTYDISFSNGSANNITLNAGGTYEVFGSESPTDLAFALPKNVKQIDFVKSICTMFNLYMEQDPNNASNLFIEPREEYYAGGQVLDWREKLDRSSGYELKLLTEVTNSNYSFKHSTDTDKLNSDYKTNTSGLNFGDFDVTINNDFVSGSLALTTIFAPTLNHYVPGYNNVMVPIIYDKDGNEFDFKTRILVNSGFSTIQGGTISVMGTTTTIFPYTSMYYNTGSEVKSILFGNPVPQTDILSPSVDHTLFNDYYAQQITSISNPNSKLLHAKFYLTTQDIYELRFNSTIYLEVENSPSYWYLNKITNFDPTQPSVTEVELLRADDVNYPLKKTPVYDPSTVHSNGGTGIKQSGGSQPMSAQVIGRSKTYSDMTQITGYGNSIDIQSTYTAIIGSNNTVSYSSPNNTVQGSGNSIGYNSVGNVIQGNNNKVGNNCTNCAILGGSGNSIPDGLSNVIITGSNITASVSNMTYSSQSHAVGSLIIPTLSTPDRMALPPTDGTVVYDTTAHLWYRFSQGAWTSF